MGRPLNRDINGTKVFGTYVGDPADALQVSVDIVSGIRCSAWFGADDTGSQVTNCFIIKQVGATRYLIQNPASIEDEDIVAGNQYIITSIGGTDFTLFGAPAGAVVGTRFTATSNGSASGNGTVNQLLRAKLVASTPVENKEGTMIILGYTAGTGTANSENNEFVGGGTSVAIRNLKKRTATGFNNNRYEWSLQNDSSMDYIELSVLSATQPVSGKIAD
jgi:hypothetical protein